jgi:hypothetical protein
MVGTLVICVRDIPSVLRLTFEVANDARMGKWAKIVGMSQIVLTKTLVKVSFLPSARRNETRAPIAMRTTTVNLIDVTGHGAGGSADDCEFSG